MQDRKGNEVKLTKEELYKLHQDLWNEIGKMCDDYKCKHLYGLADKLKCTTDTIKHNVLFRLGYTDVLHGCACCEACDCDCDNCLVRWKEYDEDDNLEAEQYDCVDYMYMFADPYDVASLPKRN